MAQQQSDGRIASNADVTTFHQATFEALRTLHTLNAGDREQAVSAGQYLVTNDTPAFPYLPRRLLAQHLAAQSDSSLLDELLTHQNPDGGFASWPGEQSTVTDTLEALEALAAVDVEAQEVVHPALQYLVAQQRDGGGFAHNHNSPASVTLTARAVGVFQQHLFDYDLAAPQQAAVTFLWQHQTTEGWGATWESAHALIALIPLTTDATRYASAVDALRGKQNSNGSWAESVYTTALVLRALYLAENRQLPIEPTTGSLTGELKDGATGLPMTGARIAVPAIGVDTLSLADGTFEIGRLEPGEYNIEYRHAGYKVVEQQVQVVAGKRLDLGTLTMQPLTDVGILQGRVIDSKTGSPIQGALVEIVGVDTTTLSTATDGVYQATLPPGTITITVTATGYQPVSATGTISAGATLQFSPTLVPEGTEPQPVLTLKGTILDGDTGMPVTGAHIATSTGKDTSSGSEGTFQLDGLTPGSLTLSVQADGYQGIQLSILAAQGGVLDLGELRLARAEAPSSSTLRGVVRDAITGEPVAGAIVSIQGTSLSTTSNHDGQFLIAGIGALDLVLAVNATGYLGNSISITLSQPQNLHVDVDLHPASVNDFAITRMNADKASYMAYDKVMLDTEFFNSGDEAQVVQFLLMVRNASGELIELYSPTHSPLPDESTDSILTVEEGERVATTFEWMTGAVTPGNYELVLQAYDMDTMHLLGERAVTVLVEQSIVIPSITISPSPQYTTIGATEHIVFTAEVTNRSNAPFQLAVSYTWRSPGGSVLSEGTSMVALEPDQVSVTFALDALDYTFSESGEYQVEVAVPSGPVVEHMEGSAVFVAPAVRVVPSNEVAPRSVVPDGDKRIRIKIKLEGRAQG